MPRVQAHQQHAKQAHQRHAATQPCAPANMQSRRAEAFENSTSRPQHPKQPKWAEAFRGSTRQISMQQRVF
eukprot:scaffold101873_cov23-Tisochrysis_lutea.AAC.7